MTVADGERWLRVPGRFPRASAWDPAWVLEKPFGANVLWLAEWLGEELGLERGARVLDLGCGRAKSSIFLAREYGVRVWAADAWVSPTENAARIRAAGMADRVVPLSVDARDLPFADGFFDAVVALDSYQYFGTDDLYLSHVARFLRPGGVLGIASAGLVRPFEDGVPAHLARLWSEDCWSLHTAAWWREHWARSGLVEVLSADTLEGGAALWLRWARATGVPAWYVETVEADGGDYLGYVRAVARRTVAVPWTPPPRGSAE